MLQRHACSHPLHNKIMEIVLLCCIITIWKSSCTEPATLYQICFDLIRLLLLFFLFCTFGVIISYLYDN